MIDLKQERESAQAVVAKELDQHMTDAAGLRCDTSAYCAVTYTHMLLIRIMRSEIYSAKPVVTTREQAASHNVINSKHTYFVPKF